MIAILFASALCLGLYQVGWQARRYAEYARLATEARAYAKEKLEEISSYPVEDLMASTYWWRTETNYSAIGAPIVRQPRVVWHKADGATANLTNAVYAEVHVDVIFRSQLWQALVTNSFPMIVK
jgi:hypothetical protein